jgi:hypothetical protein
MSGVTRSFALKQIFCLVKYFLANFCHKSLFAGVPDIPDIPTVAGVHAAVGVLYDVPVVSAVSVDPAVADGGAAVNISGGPCSCCFPAFLAVANVPGSFKLICHCISFVATLKIYS